MIVETITNIYLQIGEEDAVIKHFREHITDYKEHTGISTRVALFSKVETNHLEFDGIEIMDTNPLGENGYQE